ncbi:MAG: hypothetical protein AB8G22_00585 [Saprospiraceae bacterium]
MKKINARIIIGSLAILCSCCSYLYLGAVSCQQSQAAVSNSLLQVITEEQPVEEDQDTYLPDVQFLKKALELTKRAIQVAPAI